jgi:hypothetical protein
VRPIALAAVLALSIPTLRAHHSVLAYDGSTATTVTGTVVKVLWQNPHAYVDLDVVSSGTRTRWIVESEGPVALERLGWTASTLTPGDVITVVGARARDGSARMRCATVVTLAVQKLPCFGAAGTVSGGK